MYQLFMSKKGEKPLYCTGRFQAQNKDEEQPHVYLSWEENPILPKIVFFTSEKSAWWNFFRARETEPEKYKGWHAYVGELLR